MYCPNCGAQNADNANRCANCGYVVQSIQTPRVDVPPPPVTAGGSVSSIPTRLTGAIVLTVLNFFLFLFGFLTLLNLFNFLGVITGIVAIVFAAQVSGRIGSGNYAGATEASSYAKIMNWVSLGIMALGVIYIAILGQVPIFL